VRKVTKKSEKRIERGPSDRAIRRSLKELRELIDTSKDPIETRIAYAMETAIIWATSKTVGWPKMVDDARLMASRLRNEIGE